MHGPPAKQAADRSVPTVPHEQGGFLQILLAPGSEHVNHMRGLQSRGLMFYTAAHHETVSGADFECLAGAVHLQATGDDVNDLLMRMAVGSANPAFFHAMLRQKQFSVVRANAPFQT